MTSANPVTLPLKNHTAQHALLVVAGAVATITLNRPERKKSSDVRKLCRARQYFSRRRA